MCVRAHVVSLCVCGCFYLGEVFDNIRGVRFPGAEVKSGCELPDMGPGS